MLCSIIFVFFLAHQVQYNGFTGKTGYLSVESKSDIDSINKMIKVKSTASLLYLV